MKIACWLAVFLATAAGGAAACPDETEYGDTLRVFSGKALYFGQQFDVQAGGVNSILECGVPGGGSGYVQSNPDFTFHIHNMLGYDLTISVMSECDSVLLVNTPAEFWVYNDDVEGNFAEDAGIILAEPGDGLLDVWVGTYSEGLCDATLSLEAVEKL